MTDIGVRPVKSAVHAIEVLEFLAARQDEPARMREIADATGIPRSSLYALLRTLTERSWVRRDPTGTLYGVGLRALMAGMSYLDSDPALRMVKPWLERLNEELGETVHIGRLDGSDIVYLATKESSQYLRVINRVGRRLPASTTSLGKALLAAQPADVLESHLEYPLPRITEHTITDRAQLDADLEGIRERGYAIDLEENTAGLKCFGFALHYTNPAVDAISCSVPLARLTPERERTIVEVMAATVAEIERQAPRQNDLAGF
ncbi:IclR family transcriptional regulator [soil metagenome]